MINPLFIIYHVCWYAIDKTFHNESSSAHYLAQFQIKIQQLTAAAVAVAAIGVIVSFEGIDAVGQKAARRTAKANIVFCHETCNGWWRMLIDTSGNAARRTRKAFWRRPILLGFQGCCGICCGGYLVHSIGGVENGKKRTRGWFVLS